MNLPNTKFSGIESKFDCTYYLYPAAFGLSCIGYLIFTEWPELFFLFRKNMARDCDDFSNEFKPSEQLLPLAIMALTLYVFNVCRRLN